MDDIKYKFLKQRLSTDLQIIPEGSTVDDALDIIRSLLGGSDRAFLTNGIKRVRSSAVKEYLAKMREINDKKNEEARRVLEELTENPQKKPSLPGRLVHHEDRDPNLPLHVITVDDYRK